MIQKRSVEQVNCVKKWESVDASSLIGAEIQVQGIGVNYADAKLRNRLLGKSQTGVKDVSLIPEPGKIIAIVGPSGSGKTSLLKRMSCDFKLYERAKVTGDILVDGKKTSFQKLADSGLIVGAYHPQWKPNSKILSDMSGFARGKEDAFSNQDTPLMVLLDEPTRNLDPSEIEQAGQYIQRIAKKSAVIMAAHDIPFVIEHADQVVHLQGGSVVYESTVDEIRAGGKNVPEGTQEYFRLGFEAHEKWVARRSKGFSPAVTGVDFSAKRSAPSGRILLRSNNQTITFNPEKPKERLQAVDEVSIEIHEGETFGIIGPSGCGKSTLLKGFNQMNSSEVSRMDGTVELDDNIIFPCEDPVDIRKMFGYVAQKAVIFKHLNMMKDVTYPAVLHGLIPNRFEKRRALAEKLFRRVGLWDVVSKNDRYLKENGETLSGGEQQRLCIARAIAHDPKLLLMDEPCSALDPIATGMIEELMDQFHRSGMTTVIVTHDMSQGARVCDRVGMMYLGELVEVGAAEQIYNRPQHEQTRKFVEKRI